MHRIAALQSAVWGQDWDWLGENLIARIAAEDRGDKALSDKGLIDHYLNLYANQDTAAMADDARHAIGVLFAEARSAGLLPTETEIDWAP